MRRVIDWTGTPDDPSGYVKFRSFLTTATGRLESLGVVTAAQMKTAANWIGSPTEWLYESALAIKATLAVPGLPADLFEDLQSALDAIREGFRGVGTEPNF
jgi:hypothetical protein